jgi:channel protein (hemolysin III family)
VNGNHSHSIPGFAEPANCFTHLAGAGVFAVLTVLLLRRGRGSRPRVVFLSVFALSCVFVLSMSGVYHLLSFGSTAREVLRRLDHAAIFTLIAGTFTPVHGILFTGWRRWLPLLLIWSAAVAGIVFSSIFINEIPPWLATTFYLGMGWVGVFSGVMVWRHYGLRFIRPLVIGGVAYTSGAVVDGVGWPTLIPGVVGPHELFHVAVLVGAAAHWRFVQQFAAGKESIQPIVAQRPPSGTTAEGR